MLSGSMRAMDAGEIKAIAERYLDDHIRPKSGEDVIITKLWEFPSAWVAGYNTRAFWETGELGYSMGAAPLIVDPESGEARRADHTRPIEDQLDGFGTLRWDARED